jgi:tetratricopeptide (TPR) repeat protein
LVLEAIGGVLGSVFWGAVTNRLEGPITRYESELETALRDGLPRNHHAPRAVVRAAVRALNQIAESETRGADAVAGLEEQRAAEAFARRLKAWTHAWSRKDQGELEHADIRAMVDGVSSTLASGGEAASRELAQRRRDAAVLAMRQAVIAACNPPEVFLERFDGQGDGRGWFTTFAEFVAYELKHDDDFRTIFESSQLAKLEMWAADILAAVRETGDRVIASADARFDQLEALIREQGVSARQVGLSEAQLQGLLRELAKAGLPDEAIEGAIRGGAAELIKLREELRRHTNARAEVESLRQRAAEEIDRGDIPAARATLGNLRDRQLRAGEEAIRDAADATSRLARLDYAAGRYLEAARQHGETAELLRVFDKDEWARQKFLEADALDEHGSIFPGLSALADAVKAYEAVLEVYTRSAVPFQWAMTQNNLANVLQTLGQRLGGKSGAPHLANAVKAYEAALEVYTRDAMPSQWAVTQNNLANTLQIFGQRLGGESGAQHLADAVRAYEAALEVCTRDAMPSDWAMAQNNLANVLRVLGERLGGESGAQHLADAVKAYEAALGVYTRDAAPTDWAMTQNNLANALVTLGQRLEGESGAQHLADAVKAYEAALEVRTRDSMPSYWAMTQNNLANALLTLGRRLEGESGAQHLADAVRAYEAALEVRTRDAMPFQWAMTQNNLANTLLTLGERLGGESGAQHLADAVKAYEAALEVRTRDAMPSQWAMTQNNLANALSALGERLGGDSGAQHLADAVKAYEAALSVFDEHMPWYAEKTRRNLQMAREALERMT